MNDEKKAILAEIETRQTELQRLLIKEQAYADMIAYLRSRVNKIETRKREIHDAISDIKERVRVWEQTKTASH